jgi:hypothetical protein
MLRAHKRRKHLRKRVAHGKHGFQPCLWRWFRCVVVDGRAGGAQSGRQRPLTHVGRHLAAQAEGGLARRDGKRLSEARTLELRHVPIGSGAQFGGEGIRGPERALDRGAVGNRL